MFQSIKDPTLTNARLKNLGRQVYICIKTDDSGNHTLGTKIRTLDSNSDPELDFSLYFYTNADPTKPKAVLPVHRTTKSCLSMTPDRQLQITTLKEADTNTNILEPLEHPEQFTMTDNRFFYTWQAGTNNAFEAMNGEDTNFFLYINESNEPSLQEHNGGVYPEELLFSFDSFENENSINT